MIYATVSGSSQSQSTVLSPDVISCPDVEVTFSCHAPQGNNLLTWIITLVSNGTEPMSPSFQKVYFMNDGLESVTESHGGFSFHFTLVETSPILRSTMRTSLPLSLNTTMVECEPNTLGTGFTSDASSFLFLGIHKVYRYTSTISGHVHNTYMMTLLMLYSSL